MKIGLIAMSGIRAASEELNRAGLTMPGVVERSRIVASMPSLSLLTLAAMTPDEIEVEYHEIHDLRSHGALPDGFDLVAIASFTAQIFDAYAVADAYRARGTAVVLGGLHVTAVPDEALTHATAIAVGEGELTWPRIIADFKAGRLGGRYDPPANQYCRLDEAPVPRFNLLDPQHYNRITLQTSRGCPHRCEFCASSILLTPHYRVKSVERVIEEIRAIKRLWPRPFLEFADDNSFVNREHYKRLMRAMRDEDVRWFTECDVSVAEEPELLNLMREAGCRQVLIGLESPTPRGLNRLELLRNWKFRKLPGYAAAIREIQSHGITVNGCFILGLDGEGPEVFDDIFRFVEESGLFDVQITVLTPFPGTPLYARLLRENRIIEPGAWQKCTLFDVNHVPTHMTASELQQGMLNLAGRLYEPDFVYERRMRFIADLHAGRIPRGHGLSEEWEAASLEHIVPAKKSA